MILPCLESDLPGKLQMQAVLREKSKRTTAPIPSLREQSNAYLLKLSLRYAVPVHDNTHWLVVSRLVELDHQVAHHHRQVFDDLLPVCLHSHVGAVARRMSVHAGDDLRKGGFVHVTVRSR